MKNFLLRFHRLCNAIICWQLIISPLALADELEVDSRNNLSGVNDTATMISSFLNQGIASYTQARQGGMGNNYNGYRQRLEPALALKPEAPGSYPAVFNNCLVLPARGTTPGRNAMCSKSSPPELLSGYAQAMIDVADNNLNALQNFSTNASDRTESRGVTCYNEAISNLAQQLKQREEQLKTYRQRMKTIFDNFEMATKPTVEAIKQSDAILNGPCPDCRERNGVAPKDYLKDFKFENVILGAQDQNKCGSWFTQDAVAQTGRSETRPNQRGGLLGIEDLVTAKMQPAREYQSKQKQIRKEISNIANQLSNRFQKRNSFQISGNAVATNNAFIKPGSKAFDEAVNNFNTRINNQLEDISSQLDITAVVGTEETALNLLSQVRSGQIAPANLDKALVQYERREKKNCMSGLMQQFGSAESMFRQFRNPNVSKGISNDADNALANSLTSHFNNLDNMDIDEFLQKVKAEERKGLNSQKILTLGKTVTIEDRTINASTPLRPSDLVGIFVKNCTDQYDALDTASGYSKKEIASSVKDFSNKLDQIKRTAPATLKQSLERELVSCPSDSTTGNGANSCSDSTFDPASNSNFCMAAAQRCSSNVMACQQRVQAKIAEVKNQQKGLVDTYNREVEQATRQIVAEAQAVQNFMVTEGRRLDAMLNVGTLTELPELKITFSEQDLTRDDLPKDLAMKDPLKYMQLADEQMEALEKSLIKQREELVGASGDDPSNKNLSSKGRLGQFAAGYQDNYINAIGEYEALIADCEAALQAAQKAEAERLEGINEQNQEIADACDGIQAFNANPLEGDLEQVASDAAAAVRLAASMPMEQTGRIVNTRQDMEMIRKIRGFNQQCAENSAGIPSTNQLTEAKLCNKMNSRKESDPVYKMYEGERTGILKSCRAMGYNVTVSEGDSGTRTCDRGESPIKRGKVLCTAELINAEEIQEDDRALDTHSPDNDILVRELKCPREKLVLGSIEGDETYKYSLRYTKKESGFSATELEFLGTKDALACLPDDGSGSNDRQRERAQEQLENYVSAYNCNQEKSNVGQVGLSICGADTNGFLTEKGISDQMLNDLASATGQALAVGR